MCSGTHNHNFNFKLAVDQSELYRLPVGNGSRLIVLLTAHDGTKICGANVQMIDTGLLLQKISDASLIHGHVGASQDAAQTH